MDMQRDAGKTKETGIIAARAFAAYRGNLPSFLY